MPIRQDSRSGKWYYRLQYRKARFFEGGFEKADQARRAEAKKLNGLAEGRITPEKPAELTFAEGARWFFENHAKPNKRSWKNDRARLEMAIRFFGNKLLKDVTPEDVDAFLIWAKKRGRGVGGKGLSDNTRNHYLAELRSVFNRLRKMRKYKGDNPCIYIEMKKVPRARVRFLFPAEERALSPVVAKDSLVWPYYYVALHTGMRIGEIAKLRVEDISFITGAIFIRNSKNGRSRYVPLSEDLQKFLEDRMIGKKPADYALAGVIRDYVSRRFRWCCKEAEVTDFQFHDLRHTFAQRLLAKGEPIYKVSKILGHSSIVVTEQHYGHLALQDLKSTVDKIDGVIHLPVAAEWQQSKIDTAAEVTKMSEVQHFGEVA